MGVTGLWKLIEPCGQVVPVETLEGKVLAIDISIWLHQVIKGFQDNKGSALAHAHLLGLFHRLCKLLYYRVRPVFVFDGCVPQLKRDTIERRQLQRSKLNNEAERIQALLLESLAKEKVVQQALGATASELLLKSPAKRVGGKADDADNAIDDMFKLPELPSSSKNTNSENFESQNSDADWQNTTDEYSSSMDDSSSFDESSLRHSYNANLQAIDVRNEHFRTLPAEVRHEILVDIKETRKQSSWGRLHELPSRSDDFSSFQMKRLLKRRAVQESLEEVEQEMGGRTLTFAELKNFFTEEGIVEPTAIESANAKQICSDENTRYLLVRDLKKKLAQVKEEPCDTDSLKAEPVDVKEEKAPVKLETETKTESSDAPGTLANLKSEDQEEEKSVADEEYEADLELAIAMSLEEAGGVYSQKDYEYDSDENLKLNREQRKQLKNAAIGPARAYMIEYAGMNDEEVVGIMDKTQKSFLDTQDEAILDDINTQKSETVNSPKTAKEQELPEIVIPPSDSDTDSDLEEVQDESISGAKSKYLQINLDLQKSLPPQEDLFADVFEVDQAQENSLKETKETVESEKQPHDDNTKADMKDLTIESPKSTPPTTTSIKSQENALAILAKLKEEMADIKNIKLDDVEVNPPDNVIEISDEEQPTANEVIEILDGKDEPGDMEKEPSQINRSPILETPSKNKTISSYFETEYKIKRTPDKIKEAPTPTKVTSPFFVNKTPKSKSGRKREGDQNGTPPISPKRQISKAAKTLFSPSTEKEKPVETPKTSEELIEEAASVLREEKSAAELQELATDLARERRELQSERNRQDRMGMSVNQRMSTECQELLQLFGIPYIVAPMEAEAQCAFLDIVELTDGTITDDSDIWLFGGRTVYKNFFAQNKHVLEFRANKIEQSFKCDRKKLIQLACLVGSDYTTGVHGIGAVTALEILASFSPQHDASTSDAASIQMNAVVGTLSRFRDWWMAHKSSAAPPGSSARLALRKKLKNIELHEGFPNSAVVEAYLKPKVDESKETFKWGQPDVEAIHEFARKMFGWTRSKTDDILTPVIKKLNEKRTQATIRNYFTVKSALSVRQMQVSKRVQKAINKMNGEEEEEQEPKAKTAKKTTRAGIRKPAKRKAEAATAEVDTTEEAVEVTTLDTVTEELSASTSKRANTRSKPAPRIPNTKQSIPQREKDLQQLMKNKERAAEVMRQAANAKTNSKSGKTRKNI